MKILKLSIPIPNYENNGIFYQELFFDKSYVKKDIVLQKLNELHERDSKYPEYFGTWEDCIESLNNLEKWLCLAPDTVEQTAWTTLEKIGKVQVIWSKITVFEVN